MSDNDREALIKRLQDCKRRIGDMCKNGHPPKMSIPARPDHDDDLVICQTIDDTITALSGEQSADSVVENLATMLRRLIWQINKMDGDIGVKVTAAKAKQLLHKYGLQGNLLREDKSSRTVDSNLCASCAEKAARICEKRAEERWEEFSVTEYDTNASYYPTSIENEMTSRDEEDENCAAAIRASAGAPQ